jgi:hypothetical protein
MAQVQVPSVVVISAGDVVPRAQFRVFLKETWEAAWEESDYLEPLEFTDCAAPSMPSATFRYRFGRIKREDESEFRGFKAGRYRDRFVKIEQLPSDPTGVSYTHGSQDAPLLRWVGRVTDEALQTIGSARAAPSGNVGAGGDQYVTACGLAQELDKNVINDSVVTNADTTDEETPAPPLRIDDVLVFNDDLVAGYVETGNRSAGLVFVTGDASRSSHVFSNEKSGGNPIRWTARQIAEYLLTWHAPPGITFKLGGAVAALAFEPPEFRVAGDTVFAALNRLFDRRRGLGWSVRVNEDGTTAEVYVYTTVDKAVVFDDSTLPANANFANIPVRDLGHLVRESQLRLDTLAAYDRVVVSGERVLACFSVSFTDTTLEKAWDSDLENAYKAGVFSATGTPAATESGEKVDADRASELRFARVYTTYRIPKTWNWRAGDGIGGARVNVSLNVSNDGRVTPGDETQAPVRNWGHQLARHLPLRLAQISSGAENGVEPEYERMFAVLKLNDGKYKMAHEAKVQNGDVGHLRPLDRDFGFEISAKPNHVLAKNHWNTGATPRKSDFVPSATNGFDYDEIIATVAARTDARLRVVVDRDGLAPEAEPDRVLRIDVPNAELWWIANGTVKSVGPGGALVRETRSGRDLILRDDSPRLRQIAALAKAWYGKERAAMSLTLNDASASLPIGTYVRKVSDAQGYQQVNSVVTCVTCDCERQATTIRTQFGELDVTAGGGPSKHTLR